MRSVRKSKILKRTERHREPVDVVYEVVSGAVRIVKAIMLQP
jgi:hypothetical protein